jgi:2'-5' RNA ligase
MTTYLPEITRRMLQATAVAKTHAMVALVPDRSYVHKLSSPAGLTPDDLHVTLAYLGASEDWSDEQRTAMASSVTQAVGAQSPPLGRLWAVAELNPCEDRACMAYLVEGYDLTHIQQLVRSALDSSFQLPMQHSPWVPHITVGYGLTPAEVSTELVGSTIPFSALRLAFGDSVLDIPL